MSEGFQNHTKRRVGIQSGVKWIQPMKSGRTFKGDGVLRIEPHQSRAIFLLGAWKRIKQAAVDLEGQTEVGQKKTWEVWDLNQSMQVGETYKKEFYTNASSFLFDGLKFSDQLKNLDDHGNRSRGRVGYIERGPLKGMGDGGNSEFGLAFDDWWKDGESNNQCWEALHNAKQDMILVALGQLLHITNAGLSQMDPIISCRGWIRDGVQENLKVEILGGSEEHEVLLTLKVTKFAVELEEGLGQQEKHEPMFLVICRTNFIAMHFPVGYLAFLILVKKEESKLGPDIIRVCLAPACGAVLWANGELAIAVWRTTDKKGKAVHGGFRTNDVRAREENLVELQPHPVQQSAKAAIKMLITAVRGVMRDSRLRSGGEIWKSSRPIAAIMRMMRDLCQRLDRGIWKYPPMAPDGPEEGGQKLTQSSLGQLSSTFVCPVPSTDQYDCELDTNILSLSQEDHEALLRAETKALSTTAPGSTTAGDGTSNGDPAGSAQSSVQPPVSGSAQPSMQAPQCPSSGRETSFPYNPYYGPYGHPQVMLPPGYYPYAGPGYGNPHFPQPLPLHSNSSEPSSMVNGSGDHQHPSPHPQTDHPQLNHPQTNSNTAYYPLTAYPYTGPQYGNQHLHYPHPNSMPPSHSHSSEPAAMGHPHIGPAPVHPINGGNPTINAASRDGSAPGHLALDGDMMIDAASGDHPCPSSQAQPDHLQAVPTMDGQNLTSQGPPHPFICPPNDHLRTSPNSNGNLTIVMTVHGDMQPSARPQNDCPPPPSKTGSSPKSLPDAHPAPPPQTPPNPAATGSPSSPNTPAQFIFNDPALTGVQEIIDKMIDSPTVRRMSKESRVALFKGFKELDEVVKKISKQTHLSVSQICDRWDGLNNHPNGPMLWNMYQAFFEAFQEQELARLEEKDHLKHKDIIAGSISSKATVSTCYDHFKRKFGEKKYPTVLRAWYSMRQLSESSDLSNAQCTCEFRKFMENMDNLIRNASARLGFEAIFLAVGGIVNQDQNLSHLGGSDAMREFFPKHYRSTDHMVIGHLQAHVFDHLSKHLVTEGEDLRGMQQADPFTRAPDPSDMPIVKVEPLCTNDTDKVLAQLRELVIEKTSKFGIDMLKWNNLAWKTLPSMFKKGISSMRQDQCVTLLAAFEHQTYPVVFKKKISLGIPKDQPVIIGVPPPADSHHTHGHHLFLDEDQKTEDQKGPPRLLPSDNPSNGTAGKKPASTSNTRKAASRAVIIMDDESPPDTVENVEMATKNPMTSKKRVHENEDGLSNSEHNEDDKDETEMLSNEGGASKAPKHSERWRPKQPTKRLRFEESDDDPEYSSGSNHTGNDTADDAPIARSPHYLQSHGPARLSTDGHRQCSKGSSKGLHQPSKKNDGQHAKKVTKSTKPTSSADQAPLKALTLKKPSPPPPPKLTPRSERVAEELFGGRDMDDGSKTPVLDQQPHQLPPWQGGYYAPPMPPYAAAYHGPNAPVDHRSTPSNWQSTALGPPWYGPPGNGFWVGPPHYLGPYGYPPQNGLPAHGGQPLQVGASAQPADDVQAQGAAIQPQGK
ncbi:hypothetical protein CPB84DRAFT_1755302 [Gymnopilus junonius]|uniref:Uncharacterized protein n=1 Tax=Gymnopilus junonius TaxID=109634 RepID=A0A9P5N6N9_GYMJU|nr:hypothetical protein CPB84DRAFT_1755302 [Gymnopilus junonius]